ncbi:MAG: hypothetical protein FH762_07855 [Firmicutes bacterium]|nr:hypothetical protein [Bacillota bacterium]
MATMADKLREECKIELAKNMLENDMDIETIIKFTGLDKGKIFENPSLEENRDYYKEPINKPLEIIMNVAESFRKEGKTEVILNMLKYGIEVEEIIEVTNLNRENINIKKEVKYDIDLG